MSEIIREQAIDEAPRAAEDEARPIWQRPVTTVLEIAEATLQGHCWDADACYSTS